jgi:F0F1-type ATP synthase assembly protein I
MDENTPESRQREVVRQALTQGTAAGTQAGCVGVVLIIGALLIGRWLDSQLGTGPWLSLGILLLSIPVSLYVMVRVVLHATRRMQSSQHTGENRTDHGEFH